MHFHIPPANLFALLNLTTISHPLFITHSLTAAPDRGEGRSDLHAERSWSCDQITSMSQS